MDLLTTLNHLQNFSNIYSGEEEENEDDIVPFVACGTGEDEFDSDMNYNLSTQTGANKFASMPQY